MIYIFCDEDKKEDGSDWLYLYSAVAFSQKQYNNIGIQNIDDIRQGGSSLLNPIKEIIKSTNGFSLLSHARIPKKLLPGDLYFQTGDVSKMSTNNLAWSLSMIFTVAHLIRMLLDQNWMFKTVDLFYDPKSLSNDHEAAMVKCHQENLKQHIKNFLKRNNIGKNINIRRVNAVKKPKKGCRPDKFQLGTWLADRIVRRYNKIGKIEEGSLIKTKDITEDVIYILDDFFNRGKLMP